MMLWEKQHLIVKCMCDCWPVCGITLALTWSTTFDLLLHWTELILLQLKWYVFPYLNLLSLTSSKWTFLIARHLPLLNTPFREHLPSNGHLQVDFLFLYELYWILTKALWLEFFKTCQEFPVLIMQWNQKIWWPLVSMAEVVVNN